MDAGGALRRARRKAGLTQRELARRAGIHQPAIARIESGSVIPRVDTLDRLLRGCGYSLEVEKRMGEGVDRTQIRELLKLSPRERLDRAVVEGKTVSEFLDRVRNPVEE